MSFLSKLIRYSPTVNKTQTENTLTEWLAEGLRTSPVFFSELFRPVYSKIHISIPDPEAPNPQINTQYAIKYLDHVQKIYGRGFIDIHIYDGHITFAIEIKWDSGESGTQLRNYRNYLKSPLVAGPHSNQAFLITLAKEGLVEASETPDCQITWKEVSRALKRTFRNPEFRKNPSSNERFILREIQKYLEETEMTDAKLTTNMMASCSSTPDWMDFAYNSIQKASDRIKKVNEIDFWGRQMHSAFGSQLINHGRITTYKYFNGQAHTAYFGFLLKPKLPFDDFIVEPDRFKEQFPWAAVWIESPPANIEAKHTILDIIEKIPDQFDSSDGWHHTNDRELYQIIYRYKPMLDFFKESEPSEAVAKWFSDSINHLKETGIISAIDI